MWKRRPAKSRPRLYPITRTIQSQKWFSLMSRAEPSLAEPSSVSFGSGETISISFIRFPLYMYKRKMFPTILSNVNRYNFVCFDRKIYERHINSEIYLFSIWNHMNMVYIFFFPYSNAYVICRKYNEWFYDINIVWCFLFLYRFSYRK